MKYPNMELIEHLFIDSTIRQLPYLGYPTTIEQYVFPQCWGSTALGFGGIGGSAMTWAYTTVIWGEFPVDAGSEVYNVWGVYFNGRPCYAVINPDEEFFEDLYNHDMASHAEAVKRYKSKE